MEKKKKKNLILEFLKGPPGSAIKSRSNRDNTFSTSSSIEVKANKANQGQVFSFKRKPGSDYLKSNSN
jgi:hypothetical protein